MKSDIAIAEIAQPYAQALMSVAESKNQTEEFGEDVRSLLNLLQNSPELQNFVGNPFIEADKKKAVINEVGSQVIDASLRSQLRRLSLRLSGS